jgi:rod shape-determining protein MreC
MHGVMEDMAVISPSGMMIGYVVGCSERYSVVLPMLNIDFRTSGKIAGDDHFGSIYWSGNSPYKVEMTDLSKHADIEIGDEVVTTGLSHFFPEGIKIGYVDSYSINDTQTSYNVTVRLAADMTKLNNVILIENVDYGEITNLENNPQREN